MAYTKLGSLEIRIVAFSQAPSDEAMQLFDLQAEEAPAVVE